LKTIIAFGSGYISRPTYSSAYRVGLVSMGVAVDQNVSIPIDLYVYVNDTDGGIHSTKT